MVVDIDDAKENVSKRIDFIEGEIKKIDGQIAAKQAQQTDLGACAILRPPRLS